MHSLQNEHMRRHKLTVHDYHRMGEVGILLPETRVELIEGEIVDMPAIGSLHAGTLAQLVRILGRAVGAETILWVQNPVRLDEYSEPEPDLALLRPRADFYKSSHPGPSDVLLLIEVADTTLRYDRDVKAPLYARHGIPEVWIVDLEHRAIRRFREPRQGEFAMSDEIGSGGPVGVAAMPNVGLDLRDLFAET